MDRTARPEDASANKSLICLYKLEELVSKYDREEASLDLTMKELIQIIPDALRYPKLAGVQVLIPPIAYDTEQYTTTRWSFRTNLEAFDEPVGSFEVSYSEEVQEDYHGPFTSDEVMLFTYIANRISRIIERLRIRKQLQLESSSLQDANTALNEVLKRIQSEQSEMCRIVQANINKVILPMLNSLIVTSNKHQQGLLQVVINNLQKIGSPFASKLTSEFMALTPQELVICNLIKEGLSSKEIAHAKGISFATVNNHRENIRKKLNLIKKKVNLKTYLANNFDGAQEQ